MKGILKYAAPAMLILALSSCKKDYLVTNPTDQAPSNLVFTTTAGAQVALDGLYRMHYVNGVGSIGYTGHDGFAQKAIDMEMDLEGNDMVVHSAGYGWFNGAYRYTAQTSAADGSRSDFMWTYYYRIINNANSIINNIDAAAGAQADKDNIKGQALAIRAYSYFYLVNLFQQTYKGNESKPGVPVYTTGTLEGKGRGTVKQVYDQINADLTQAETLLTGKTRRDKSSVNINVVQGIRARVALQMEDYATAATYANKARQGYTLMTAADYQAGFNDYTNKEWIWGMKVITDQATIYASLWSHFDVATSGYAALGTQKKITKSLYDQIPTGDVRKTTFNLPTSTSSSYPAYNQTKFHVATPGAWAGDYLLMRAAEMYLIEAEALARTGSEPQAIAVLETLVKARNSAYSATGLTGSALINEILLQRRIELWGEGFSLLDIKRLHIGLNRPTGTGNHGGTNLDPIVYSLADQDPKFLYRIPQRELNANKAMTPADQNP